MKKQKHSWNVRLGPFVAALCVTALAQVFAESEPEETPPVDAAIQQTHDYIADKTIDKTRKNWRTQLPPPPALVFADGTSYSWLLKTNKGDMTLKFMPDVAPKHVANFIYLTELDYFDGLSFHRVITGFMAQGGCPLGTGTGGPGYEFAGEFLPTVKHSKPGMLSMANRGPNTDGSQFFITFVPTPHLDGRHTIFGEVVEGQDTLKTLEAKGSRSGQPSEPLEIIEATIVVE
jgi:cyclophilin family peptidyl-prolyl cis-trans isomerase